MDTFDRVLNIRELSLNCLWSAQNLVSEYAGRKPPKSRIELFTSFLQRRIEQAAESAITWERADARDALDLLRAEAAKHPPVMIGQDMYATAHEASVAFARKCSLIAQDIELEDDSAWYLEVTSRLADLPITQHIEAAIQREYAWVFEMLAGSQTGGIDKEDVPADDDAVVSLPILKQDVASVITRPAKHIDPSELADRMGITTKTLRRRLGNTAIRTAGERHPFTDSELKAMHQLESWKPSEQDVLSSILRNRGMMDSSGRLKASRK